MVDPAEVRPAVRLTGQPDYHPLRSLLRPAPKGIHPHHRPIQKDLGFPLRPRLL